MSDDEDEDTHFCLRCNATITGLDAYVAHRKSRCNQIRAPDQYGPGPSGLQPVPSPDDRADSPERTPDPATELLLHPALSRDSLAPSTSQKDVPEADDYFFSSLCLQSSAKSGESSNLPAKHHGVLTRSKILEKSAAREEKPIPQMEEGDALVDSESDESDDERHPPPTSGGKWLPGFRPSYRSTTLLWKSETPEHKPAESEVVVRRHPPPSHTRGKWDSSERPWGPLRKPNAYWCGPCNRRLSSRVVYERHIKSELHFKRTNPWRNQANLGKRNIRRTRIAQESTLRALNRRSTREVKGTKRRRGTTICDICNYRVAPHLMGKHLISHYHWSHPKNDEKNNALVLRHMLSVVHQAPFQCGLCKFYCNDQQAFLTHWASEMHLNNDVQRAGVYWCPNCNFEADSSMDMGCHLVEDLHRDRVAIINHSVPVIIQKITPLQCDVCGKCFRYNVQVRAHSKLWGHEQNRGSASASYQEALSCSECPYRCNSLVSFQRHCYMKHRKVPYFCRRCGMSFKSSQEVKEHRKSTEHRDAAGSKTRHCPHCKVAFHKISSLKIHLEDAHPHSKHRCLKCGACFTLKQQLSQHASTCQIAESPIREQEPLDKTICQENIDSLDKTDFKCDRCQFSVKTESELLVHKLLHDGGESSSGKFKCPYCHKTFNGAYMKKHMMTHTSERPFTCEICNYSFRRQDTLSRHVANIHQEEMEGFRLKFDCDVCGKSLPSQTVLDRHITRHHETRARCFKCSECDRAFFEKGTLDRHMQTHFGKKFQCAEDGCIFNARSMGELKIHARTHSESRDFHCQQCSYSSKTNNQLLKHVKAVHAPRGLLKCSRCPFTCQTGTHLRRHLRTHTGSKPYQCPHCAFSCTSLDNLRKHIIYSKIHPGKRVYECHRDGCDFSSNLSKDFKSHLVLKHNLLMRDATAHVAGIYKAADDTLPVDDDKVHEMRGVSIEAERSDEEREKMIENEMEEVEEEAALEEFVYSSDVVETDGRLPTLASVALTPAKTEEDIIFIHIGGPDEQHYDPHMFHQSFPIIENFPGQSHYDATEIEHSQEDQT